MKIKQRIMSVMLTMALALTVLCGTVFNVSAAASYNNMVGTTYSTEYAETKYTLDSKYNGTTDSETGYLTVQSLVNDDVMINEANFKKLTNESQRQLIKDMNSVAEDILRSDSVNEDGSSYSDEDYQNWVQQLQQCDGVGSRLISTLMANTKPDFASANRIYQPFSGTVGTVLGLVAVLLMAALAIVMVLDLSYIAIPLFVTYLTVVLQIMEMVAVVLNLSLFLGRLTTQYSRLKLVEETVVMVEEIIRQQSVSTSKSVLSCYLS